MKQNTKKEIKIHISLKLIITTAILFALSFAALIYFVKETFPQYLVNPIEETNYSISVRNASAVEREIKDIRSDVLLFLDTLNSAKASRTTYDQIQSYFFQRHGEVVSVILSNNKKFYNNNYFFANGIEVLSIDDYINSIQAELQEAEAGSELVLNAAPFFKLPLMALLYNWNENGLEQTVTVLVSTEKLTDVYYSQGNNLSYAVNHRGDLLIHPDYSKIEAGVNLSSSETVKNMRSSTEKSAVSDVKENDLIYSFAKIGVSDLAVITESYKNPTLEPLNDSVKLMMRFSGAMLFAVLLIVFIVTLFAKRRIRKNIRKVTELVESENP